MTPIPPANCPSISRAPSPNRDATRSVALLFPGQGSQAPRMLASLNDALPGFRAARARLDAELGLIEGKSVERWIAEGSETDLKRTEIAQPALCLVERAALEALSGMGVSAGAFLGHSFGELVALSASGAFDASTLCALSKARGQSMKSHAVPPSAMLAVRASRERVLSLLLDGESLWIANDNGPEQIVVAGTKPAVTAFAARAKAARVATVPLKTACAFHTPLMQAARAEFDAALCSAQVMSPNAANVYSNVTAEPYPHHAAELRRLLSEQITAPVRLREAVEALYAAGARVYLEVGPGRVLSELVGKILGARSHVTLSLDPGDEDPLQHIAFVMATLSQHGVAQPATASPELTLAAAQPFFESNSAALERFFAQQRLLVERLAPRSQGRETLFRELVNTNGAVLSDFFAAQQAFFGGAGSVHAAKALPETPAPRNAPVRPLPVREAPPQIPPSAEHADAKSIEDWLCQAVSELTGFPRELVKPTSELENELGLDSITLLEVYTKLTDAFPQLAGRGAEMRKARSIADATRRMLGASSPASAAVTETVPVMDPGKLEAKQPAPLPMPSSAVARSVHTLLESTVGRVITASDLDADFGKRLGIDAFTRRELVQRLVSAYPDLDVAGRELSFAATPRELLQLCEGVLGSDKSDEVERFERVKEPLREDLVGELPGQVWLVGPVSHTQQQVQSALTALGIRVESIDPADVNDARALAVRKLSLGIAQHTLLFVTPEPLAEQRSDETWFRFVKHVDEIGRPLRLAVLGTQSLLHDTVCGLARALAHEWPTTSVRAMEVTSVLDAELVLRAVRGVLHGDNDLDLTLSSEGLSHHVLKSVSLPVANKGEAPLIEGAHVLLLGGGDGITARVAELLAERGRCKISAVGRSPWPASAPYPLAKSDAALRAVLREELSAEHPDLDAKSLAARLGERVASVQRQRALLATRARVEAAGGSFAYASADARDRDALEAAIAELKRAHGPVEGFVHGAGVIEDAPLSKKSVDSFRRVFDTKLESALHARALLRDEPLRFAFLFSSLTAFTGNVGQIDYVAANQALDGLARAWNESVSYPVRSLAWSVWHESGLAPGWAKALIAQDGTGGISDAVGRQHFWNELALGDKGVSWALFAPQRAFSFVHGGGLLSRERAHG